MSFTYWLDHTLSGCQRPSARLTAGSQVNLFSAAVSQLPLIPGTPVRVHISCPAQPYSRAVVNHIFRLMTTTSGDHQVMRFPATNTCFSCIATLSELEHRCVSSNRFGLHISNAIAVKDRRSVMAYPCRISDYQRQQGQI